MKIAVLGCSGRMGRMLVQEILARDGVSLSGVTDRPGAPWIGQDLGGVMELEAARGLTVVEDVSQVVAGAEALIDFTTPDATVVHARLAAKQGCAHVIGTTGFAETHLTDLAVEASRCVQVRAGNMSLGVNLLTALVEKVAAALDDDFDIEVVEMHHNQKVDAPSGTALMFGEAAAKGRGVTLEAAADRGRDGITGARERGHIGFVALRGGDVVGEHEVIFAGPGERVALRHIASDRGIFARGAVKAALWTRGRAPGVYSMMDVLGLG